MELGVAKNPSCLNMNYCKIKGIGEGQEPLSSESGSALDQNSNLEGVLASKVPHDALLIPCFALLT